MTIEWVKISTLWDITKLYGRRATVTEITGPDAYEDLGMVGATGTLCAKNVNFKGVIGIQFDDKSLFNGTASLFSKDSIVLLD